MKVVFVGINAKFSHTNIAIRYLNNELKSMVDSSFEEFTINEPLEKIVYELHKKDADILMFSTYIWNVDQVRKVITSLKKIKPSYTIVLGGPEVSFEKESFLRSNPACDYIIYGEGERAMKDFVLYKQGEISIDEVHNLAYIKDNRYIKTEEAPLIDMKDLSFPYEDEEALEHRTLYYEAQRGCPYRCSFCLSSAIKGLRYKPIDLVKKDLDRLISMKPSIVKFIDRTFNSNEDFAINIIEHILENNKTNTKFHFEITLDRMTDRFYETLKKLPKDMVQFEIGLQSINPMTLKAIQRHNDLEKIKEHSQMIKKLGTIHQHIDLIAGLPYEDFESFKESFNYLYTFKIEKIQLGFLKMLKGSLVRSQSDIFRYEFTDYAPYEVLKNDFLSTDEIIILKKIDYVVDKIYNEGSFKRTLDILERVYLSPFAMFEDMANFIDEKFGVDKTIKKEKLYGLVYEFLKAKDLVTDEFVKALSLDYAVSVKSQAPLDFMPFTKLRGDKLHSILRDEEFRKAHLRKYIDEKNKDIINKVAIIVMDEDAYLVDDDIERISDDYVKRYNLYKHRSV
ncbi:B12-binding domain-containing radical SAM protein [Fenollaria sporofastidiosus]|uniref:B12-binding domain-containing radical SAM protein n=1 Tax=Fenollaria sporofastidiosus TaxID=2811778 RepID=UPI001C007218|nr:radical SAM protein [Fenollaria sporofastidiosus]